MIETLLQKMALFCRRRYRLVFVVAGVLVLLSAGLASTLRFDSDILALLPEDEPRINTFRETLSEFGGIDLLLVVVGIPEAVASDPYLAFAVRLGDALGELEDIDYVDYRIGEMEDLVEQYLPSAFFLLDEEGRRIFEERLSDEAIRLRVAEIRRQLSTPQAVAAKELLKLDPLGISDAFIDQLSLSRGAVRVDLSTGFFLSEDRRLLLLLAKPRLPPQELLFTRRMIARVSTEIEAVLSEWDDIAGIDPPPAPTVRLGGNYATALDDEAYIRRDVIVNAVTSMLGVLLLFLFAFRRISLLAYAFVPLSMGLAMTYGFTAATVGALNVASSGFAALLVGLGIDFVIVSYGRYVEERSRGRSLEEALRTMSGSSGRAVVVGAITSAATFYAFASTEFVGLRQMGLLTGTGILFCMIAVLFLLPAMLARSEDRHSRRESFPRLFLHGFGSARVIRFSLKHPKPVLFSGIALTLLLGAMTTQLRFEDSMRAMRPEGREGAAVEVELSERFGSGFDSMMLVLSGRTLEEVLELTDRAVRAIEPISGGEEIVRYESIASILPPRSRQEETLAWLREKREDAINPERIRRVFEEASAKEGIRVEPFLHGLDLFTRAASVDQPIEMRDLALDDSSRRLLERFVRQTPSGWKSIVYLYPSPLVWKRNPPPSVVALADELGPQSVLTGVNMVSAFLRETVKRDAVWASIVGFVLVALLLWLDFKRPLDTMLCLAPLSIGIVWMLGTMALLGLAMNFFNIFVTTMIIGIGADYGIHMMHRYRESRAGPRDELESGLEKTGKAVVLAALSTMVGFGSLSLSSYPGLRSMGVVAILGALATALVAITLLPAYLSLRLKRSEA